MPNACLAFVPLSDQVRIYDDRENGCLRNSNLPQLFECKVDKGSEPEFEFRNSTVILRGGLSRNLV